MIKVFSSLAVLFVLFATSSQAINFQKVGLSNMSFVLMAEEKSAANFISTGDLRYEVIAELLKSAGTPSARRVTIFLDYKYSFLNPTLSNKLDELDNQVFSSQENTEVAQVLSTYNNRDQFPITSRAPVVYSNKARILYGYMVGENTTVRSNDSIINIGMKNVDAIFYQSSVNVAKTKKAPSEGEDQPEAEAAVPEDNTSVYKDYVDARDKTKEQGKTLYKKDTYNNVDDYINATRYKVISKIQNLSPSFPNQYGALIEVYDSDLDTLTYYLIGVYRGDFIKFIWTNNR